MVKVDLRKSSARVSMEYMGKADFFALAVNAGNHTHFLIVTSEALRETLRDQNMRNAFEQSADGLRWKGLQATKARVKDLIVRLDIAKAPKAFEVKNGTRADDMERTVCAALNMRGLLGGSWRVCATERWEGGYTPDLVNEQGQTVEVKGFHARLFN